MIGIDLYYGFAALFMLGVILTAFVAVRSDSVLRYTVPFTVALSCAVSYWGLDLFLGTAKPANFAPGWQQPHFGPDGVIVLGGKIDAGAGLYLLLQEDATPAPRLWFFAQNSDMVRNLKQAMEKHAKDHGGQPWGFRMKPNGDAADGKEGKGGKGGPKADKPADGNAGGETSLENRPSPFTFAEPQPKSGPEKDGGAPFRDLSEKDGGAPSHDPIDDALTNLDQARKMIEKFERELPP